MPELPEVEIVKRGMEAVLCGRSVLKVDVLRYDLRIPVPDHFCEAVQGRRISAVNRRGKYIIFSLDSNDVVIIHLGMSGRVKVFQPDDFFSLQKHDHVCLHMEGDVCVVYHDPRRFGFMVLADAVEWEQKPPFLHMGPEPLDGDKEFYRTAFYNALSKRRGPIKTVLLDQRVIAGLGNIYVCEALYDSGISPDRPAFSLRSDEVDRLAASIRKILLKAIEAGGSTLRDYHHTDGSEGGFQYLFSVYGREGKPCGSCVCETGVVIRTVQGGRSTFSCPVKQV